MNDYLLYVGIAVVTLLVFIVLIINKKKVKETSINMDDLNKLFHKDDISKIEFIRNKIVITFKDITLFNVEVLHGTFAKGVTVVGDKIKFFISEDSKVNEKAFISIKSFIEG